MSEVDERPGSGAQQPGGTVPARRDAEGWERQLLEKLLMGTLEERRRARRWSIFFRLLAFVFAGFAIVIAMGWLAPDASKLVERHTALVELKGTLEVDGEASADNLVSALRSAFEDDKTVGVVLRINSPGGSPVQAGIVHDEIRRLREKYPDTPLYAVIEEVCASGGYYVAAAADRIFVDKASLVGSIGVLMDGFGFVGAMDKLGVERRLLTAGENKGFLDSFSPMDEAQRRHAQSMLDQIHRQFIEVVRKGRGDRLKDDPALYSGLIWTGEKSIELGLADEFGTLDSVARDVIKAEEVVDFSAHESLAEKLARRIGAEAGRWIAKTLATSGQVPQLR